MRILRLSHAFALWTILLFICAGTSLAQVSGVPEMPAATEPLYVAMIFHKITDMPPDVYSWARQTKEYDAADLVDRETVVRQKVREFVDTFNLISPVEKITLNTVVSLSPYDPSISGFEIKAFSDENVAFPVQYANEYFRLVPQGILSVHRISVSEAFAKEVWQDTEKGRKARVEIQLTPVAADYEEDPLEYKGSIRWPALRTKVESVRIWSADRKKMLWESHDSPKGILSGLFSLGHW